MLTADHLDRILTADRDSMMLLLKDWSVSQAAAPMPAALVGPCHDLHLNPPPEFDGVSANVSDFLAMICCHILAYPSDFAQTKTQVLFLLSYCSKGFARTWRNRMISEIDSGNYEITSWYAFETLFKDTFLNHYTEDDAARKIALIRQGKQSAQEFLIAFDELVIRSNFNHKAVVYALKNALNP